MHLEQVIAAFLTAYPRSYEPIAKRAEEWIMEDGSVLLVSLFGSIAERAKVDILSGETGSVLPLFDLIESMVASSDRATSTAAATGFLEGLANREDEAFAAREYRDLLGAQSRAHLAAWDAFHGVKS